MRRIWGFAPIALLTVATAVGVVVGLRLGGDVSPRDVAHRLGCAPDGSVHPQPGMSGVTCAYRGSTITILHLDPGGYSFSFGAEGAPEALLLGPADQTHLLIQCPRRQDCVDIEHRLGGEVEGGGSMFGLSLGIE